MATKQAEGPVPDYNGGNSPGGALKLPTKHYKSSDLGKNAGKGNSIEGPTTGKKY